MNPISSILEAPSTSVYIAAAVLVLFLLRAMRSQHADLPRPTARLRFKLHDFFVMHLPGFAVVPTPLLASGPVERDADTAQVSPNEIELYFSAKASIDMVQAEIGDFFIEEMDCRIRLSQRSETSARDSRYLIVERYGSAGTYRVQISLCPVRDHFRVRIGRYFEAH